MIGNSKRVSGSILNIHYKFYIVYTKERKYRYIKTYPFSPLMLFLHKGNTLNSFELIFYYL